MSLLQDVLRSHTTDTLDKQLSITSTYQRTQQLNPDKDDSDDELVNVVRLALTLFFALTLADFRAFRYQHPVPLLARALRRALSHPHAERSIAPRQDPYILADRANNLATSSRSSRPICPRKFSID